jgi:hypothetical protein
MYMGYDMIIYMNVCYNIRYILKENNIWVIHMDWI